MISDFETEAEALAYVRELIEQGWKIDEILFMVDDPAWADEDVLWPSPVRSWPASRHRQREHVPPYRLTPCIPPRSLAERGRGEGRPQSGTTFAVW